MAVLYTLDQYVNDLRAITAKENDPVKITDLVAPLARKFAQSPGWFRPEYRECDAEQGFGVHMLHEEPNHDLAVFLVSWLPNRGTTPHNHKTWAVVVGMEGEEKEISYDRLDDGARPGFADLKRGGEQVITAGEITRCYPEHIHSVWNVGKNISKGDITPQTAGAPSQLVARLDRNHNVLPHDITSAGAFTSKRRSPISNTAQACIARHQGEDQGE